MFALGKDFNLLNQLASGTVRVNLRAANGVTLICTGAATSGNVTVNECNAASGGTSQALARITAYWTQTNGVWTKVTQAAAATFPMTAAGISVAEVETSMLSDGFSYITASHATANTQVLHVVRGLEVQRNPTFLADIRA